MLVIYRRHKANCSKAGALSQDCPSKPKCPIHFEGVDGAGIRRKRRALVDPATEGGVRDWNRAVEIIRELEIPVRIESVSKPQGVWSLLLRHSWRLNRAAVLTFSGSRNSSLTG